MEMHSHTTAWQICKLSRLTGEFADPEFSWHTKSLNMCNKVNEDNFKGSNSPTQVAVNPKLRLTLKGKTLLRFEQIPLSKAAPPPRTGKANKRKSQAGVFHWLHLNHQSSLCHLQPMANSETAGFFFMICRLHVTMLGF